MAIHWHRKHERDMGLLDRIGLRITNWVGTMVCAVIFAIIALISAPAAFESKSPVIIVQWISGNFLQLVLLSIIMVGTNLQAQRDKVQADADYQTNVLAEKEIEKLHNKIDKLLERENG